MRPSKPPAARWTWPPARKPTASWRNLIAAELPQLHLYLFTEGYGASDQLSGYVVNMWGSLTWDVQNWKW